MSTKITDGKLVVRVIEEVDLNGRTYGNTNKHEITGINEVSERSILQRFCVAVHKEHVCPLLGMAGGWIGSQIKRDRIEQMICNH